MSVIAAYLLPHPPLIFPEIGRGQERKINRTIKAYRAAAADIAVADPDTIVLISPHADGFRDFFQIFPDVSASGDMTEFGAPEVSLEMTYDTDFVDTLNQLSLDEAFPAGSDSSVEPRLDHATMVPLRFISQARPSKPYRFVRISITGLSLDAHWQLGHLIARVATALDRRVVVVASGDLSHRLLASGPYGFSDQGVKFDKIVKSALQDGALQRLLELSPEFCDQAGECGHRPLTVMAGCIGQRPFTPKLLSYQAPFGVGYLVASFHIFETDQVKLARLAVETYVKSQMTLENPERYFPKLSLKPAGVFVSIKKLGELRGCIGTTQPTTPNIAQEITQNAVSAAVRDPRFSSINPTELPQLSYSVDILAPPELVDQPDLLDPSTYGVIVRLGSKSGLLLPDLDGIDSSEQQIAIAMQKAGIPFSERDQIKLQRFRVERYY
jgi:AmmeMemoRadiSam system protein A/AmmeMemoRadiSam system protein B